MASEAPRPKNNSDGQKKKPSANPDGGARPMQPPQGQPGMAPSLVPPGVQMVGQLAQQAQSTGMVPQTPGAGVPDALQSFPQDVAGLMQVMKQGYAPGADPVEHGMAQNAHAVARAQERAAQQSAQAMGQDEEIKRALGGLIQSLSLQGKLPAPQDVAAQAAGPQQPLTSSYT
jgi:hypothetical protein